MEIKRGALIRGTIIAAMLFLAIFSVMFGRMLLWQAILLSAVPAAMLGYGVEWLMALNEKNDATNNTGDKRGGN